MRVALQAPVRHVPLPFAGLTHLPTNAMSDGTAPLRPRPGGFMWWRGLRGILCS